MITCKSCREKKLQQMLEFVLTVVGIGGELKIKKNIGNVIVVFALIIIIAAVIEKYIF